LEEVGVLPPVWLVKTSTPESRLDRMQIFVKSFTGKYVDKAIPKYFVCT
jgi:hypothetical protein